MQSSSIVSARSTLTGTSLFLLFIFRSYENYNSEMQTYEPLEEILQSNSMAVDTHTDNQHIKNISIEMSSDEELDADDIKNVSFEMSSDVELDADDNEDDADNSTFCTDINDINAKIPIYTNYYEHVSGHLQFYNAFKNNSFGHSCAVCDRLWCEKDLKNTTQLHDDILQVILPVSDFLLKFYCTG